LGTIEDDNFIKKAYSSCQSISIDYGVLEKADNVFVLEANMDWSDLGTWSSLSDHTQSDVSENAIVRGKAYTHECTGNLISIAPGKVAILQGLNDYIVVETGEALLIIKKEDEQNIKLYLKEIFSLDTF
jgi:mannose-1-phosphate guanylyltransferase